MIQFLSWATVIVWTISSLLAFVYSWAIHKDARDNLLTARAAKVENGRKIISENYYRTSLIRVTMLGLFLLVAFLAVLGDLGRLSLGVFLRLFLVPLPVLLAYDVYRENQMRKLLERTWVEDMNSAKEEN